MPVIVKIFRRRDPGNGSNQDTDGNTGLISEEVTFPRTTEVSDVRVQAMANGTIILVGPTKWVGIGLEVLRWEAEFRSRDKEDLGTDDERKDVVTLSLDNTDLAALEIVLADSKPLVGKELQRSLEYLRRSVSRKRGVVETTT